MSRGNFDIDSFISEVEERPAIWNMHVPEYSNRVAKQQAWDELVMIFYNLDGPVQKLRALGSKLQKKWKTLRDSYTREERKLKTMMSNSKALPRISFRHYERLRFLHNSVKKYDTESSFEMSMDENDRLNNIMRPNEDSMEKNKLDSADVCFRKILDIKSKEYNLDELDEDKLFCLTLSREFKKVPETRRLKLKAEIYNLILFNQLSESQQHDKLLNSKSVSNMPTNAVADSSMGTSTEVTEPNGMVFGKTIFQNCNEMENFKGNRKYKRSESSHEKSRLSFHLESERLSDCDTNDMENNDNSLLKIRSEEYTSCEIPIEFENHIAKIKKEIIEEDLIESPIVIPDRIIKTEIEPEKHVREESCIFLPHSKKIKLDSEDT